MQRTNQSLISRPEASLKYGRSDTTMWRDERDGLIPPAIKINRRKFWLVSELDLAYLGARAIEITPCEGG